MKNRQFFIFLFCVIFSSRTFSQNVTSTFSLTDTTFKTGSVLRTYSMIFDLGKITLKPESFAFLDSLYNFLDKNKQLAIEIDRYGDNQKPESSIKLGEGRARAIRDYLVEKGISIKRFYIKSYGDRKPIFSQVAINQAKTKEQKEELNRLNRRTEFVIVSTSFTDNLDKYQTR